MWQTQVEAQTGSEGGYALSSTQSKKAYISCHILDKAKGTYKIHKVNKKLTCTDTSI
jgi:hypothetical protein